MGRMRGVQQSNFEGEGEREEQFLLLKMLITDRKSPRKIGEMSVRAFYC